MNLTTASSQEHVDRHECRRDEGEGEREDGDGGARAGGNCIKIGLPGKLILRDYFLENRTSRRPFLLLRIRFRGRPIFIQLVPGALVGVDGAEVEDVDGGDDHGEDGHDGEGHEARSHHEAGHHRHDS